MRLQHDHQSQQYTTNPELVARNAAREAVLQEEVEPATRLLKMKKRVAVGLGVTVAGASLAGGIAIGMGGNSNAKGPAPSETETSQAYDPSSTTEEAPVNPEVTEDTVVYNDNGVERQGIIEYARAHQLVSAESGPEGRVFTAATNDDEVHQMLGTHFADFSSVINLRTDLPEEQDKEFAELAVNSTIFGEGAKDSEAADMLEEDRELNKAKPGSVTYKVERVDHQAYQEGAIAGYVIFDRTGPDGQSQKYLYNVALNLVSGAWKAEDTEVSAIQ